MNANETALTTLPTVFGEATASQVLALAKERAVILADVIKRQHLFVTISGRDHVLVEGWTFLGSMVGLFPTVVWSRPVFGADGVIIGAEARVEVVSASGQLRGSAEASCLYEERSWGDRPFYALRSMAQTRATSKALRLPLGFVMVLAGYEATPAEEMGDLDSKPKVATARPYAQRAPAGSSTRSETTAIPRQGPRPAPSAQASPPTAHEAETSDERRERLLALSVPNVGALWGAAYTELGIQTRAETLKILGKGMNEIVDPAEEWRRLVNIQVPEETEDAEL